MNVLKFDWRVSVSVDQSSAPKELRLDSYFVDANFFVTLISM